MPNRSRLRRKPSVLTLSGGTLRKLKNAVEFRIWVSPVIGDDYYYRSTSLSSLQNEKRELRKEGVSVDEPIAVVYDKKAKNIVRL